MSTEFDDNSDLISSIKALHDRYVFILQECEKWNKIKPIVGLHRYTNSLVAEKQFLEKLLDNPALIKKEHVQSTNLGYLEPVYEALVAIEQRNGVMQILGVPFPDDDTWMSQAAMIKRRSIKVDIVADNGLTWIKVIARNAKAFRHEVMGLEQQEEESDDDDDDDDLYAVKNDFDNLPIFKKAREYLTTAQAHHVHFCTPTVVFAFLRIRPDEDIFVQKIMDRLREIGIVVYLHTLDNSLQSICQPKYKDLTTEKVNLDVSSIFALISELSHHPCPPDGVSALPIKIQAEREAVAPCLPQMKALIKGKKLFMITSAYERLKEIVQVVGGSNEQMRFKYLFRNALSFPDLAFDPELWTILPSLEVQVIQDAPIKDFFKLLEPPLQKSKLNNGRKIRTQFSEFHAVLFGSGGYYRMTTFTAIQWMEKALADAGVLGNFTVCHEPRSLAEQKMLK